MNSYDILNDNLTKSKVKRRKIVDAIISGDLSFAETEKLIGIIKDDQLTIILEAIEEITKKGLKKLDIDYLSLSERYIPSTNDKVKEKAS